MADEHAKKIEELKKSLTDMKLNSEEQFARLNEESECRMTLMKEQFAALTAMINTKPAEFHWNWKWLCRPNQKDGMRVEEYYNQFCEWKEEMASLPFSVEEQHYIDGFIENLRCSIRSRLSKYNFSGVWLINAALAAKFEESMMVIDEAFKKNDAHKPVEEMPSRDLEAIQPSDQVLENVGYDKAIEDETTTKEAGVVDKVQGVLGVHSDFEKGADKVLDGTTIADEIGLELFHPQYITEKMDFQPSTLENEDVEVAHQLFDKLPQPLDVAPNQKIDPDKGYILPLSPLFDCAAQIFYPRSNSLTALCGSIGLNGVNHDFDMMLGKQDVELQVGEIMLFTFDPGGISRFRDSCDSLLFTNDTQHFSKSYGLAGSVLAFFGNGKVMLTVLFSHFSVCIGKDLGTVVEVMVVYFKRFLLSFTTYDLAKAMVIWNLLVHIWRDIVAAFSKVKMAKSQYESTVSGHGLKASRSLIECCKETNLRVPGSTWKWVDFLVCDAINKRSNAFEFRDNRLHHDQFSAIKVNGICRQYNRGGGSWHCMGCGRFCFCVCECTTHHDLACYKTALCCSLYMVSAAQFSLSHDALQWDPGIAYNNLEESTILTNGRIDHYNELCDPCPCVDSYTSLGTRMFLRVWERMVFMREGKWNKVDRVQGMHWVEYTINAAATTKKRAATTEGLIQALYFINLYGCHLFYDGCVNFGFNVDREDCCLD